jgi:hypothetical protein
VGGIILLVLIGAGVAWLWTRGRTKMKLPVNGKTWIGIIIIVFVVLALLYGAQNVPHTTSH